MTGSAESHHRGGPSQGRRSRPQRGYTYPHHSQDYQYMSNDGPHEPPGAYTDHHEPWHPEYSQPYGYPPYGRHEPPYAGPTYGSRPQYHNHRSHGSMHTRHDYIASPYPHANERDYPYHPERRPPPRDSRRGPPRDYWQRFDNVRSVAPVVEPWMDDLDCLDIPDNRGNPSHIVWRPPQAVARPLPSTWTDRDDAMIPPPLSSLPRGMSISKYILDKKPDEFGSNIRETEDWPFMMDDPIFLEIPMNSDLISVKELIEIRNKVYETHRVETSPIPIPEVNSEEGVSEEEVNIEYDIVDANEEEINETDTHSGHSEVNDDAPKASSPISSPQRQDVPVSPHVDGTIEPDDYQESHEKDSQTDQLELYSHQNPAEWAGPQNQYDRDQDMRGDNRWANNGHYSGYQRNVYERRPNNFRGQFRRRGGRQHHFLPPPPPPPNEEPEPQQESVEYNIGTPDDSFNTVGDNTGENSYQHRTIINNKPTPANDFNENLDAQTHHKRTKPTDSADSDGDEPRRQIDDVTPRIKRRQPQVAEAYSRRW
ncbi:hypothetical protein LOZ55_000267 [Ophidiomyces ophidiicola]|nr:hypothetical protein LOZ55_000267 [Ophidiomyces ophidiicola]